MLKIYVPTPSTRPFLAKQRFTVYLVTKKRHVGSAAVSVLVASELQPAQDPSRLLSKIKKLLETQSIAKLNFAVTVICDNGDTEKEVFDDCDNVGIGVRVCVSIINFSYFSYIYTFTHYT